MGAGLGATLIPLAMGAIPSIISALKPADQSRFNSVEQELSNIRAEREQAKRELEEAKQERLRLLAEAKTAEERKKALENGDVKTYAENIKQLHKAEVSAIGKLPDPDKTEKRSMAFMGKTSAGKSSLINRLFKTDCKTDPLRCTQGTDKVYEDESLEVFDIFGDNDDESYHNLNLLMTAKTLHILVIVYTDSIDSNLDMAQMVCALKVPAVFVRNKSEKHEGDDATIQRVKSNDLKQIRDKVEETGFEWSRRWAQNVGLVLTSADTGMGMDELMSMVTGARERGCKRGRSGSEGRSSRARLS